jgi:TolA-binding protein
MRLFPMSFRRTGMLLLIGVVFASSSLAAEPDQATRSYQAGNGFLNRGLDELAIREYRAFLEQRPNHELAPSATYGLGVALFRLHRLDDAAEALEPLVGDVDFEFAAETNLLLGQCYLSMDRFVDAAKRFQTLIDQAPNHPSAAAADAMLVESHYRAQNYADAERAAIEFRQRWPNNERRDRVNFFFALSAMSQKEYQEAADRFDLLLDNTPESSLAPQATLLSAQCLQQVGLAPRAIKRFRQAIEGAAGEMVPDAIYGLATLVHAAGELDEAGALFDQLVESASEYPNLTDAMLRRGQIWFAQGRYRRAREAILQADQRADADHTAANYWLAKCALRLNDPEDAADRLADALQSAPDHPLAPEMLYDRAVALLRLERPGNADRSLALFTDRFPTHALAADALALRASTLHQLKRYRDSAALCGVYLNEYANRAQSSAIRYLRCENLYLDGDIAGAVVGYADFLDREPDNPEALKARFRLGSIHYGQGDYELAAPLLQATLSHNPLPVEFHTVILMLGEIAFAGKDWREAESLYESYSRDRDAPGADEALLKLGLSRQRQGDYAGALKAYDDLFQRSADSPVTAHARFEQGQSLVALDRLDEAADAFEQVVEQWTDSRFTAAAYGQLGAIAATKNEHASANFYFEKSLSLNDDPAQSANTLHRLGLSLAAVDQNEEAARVFDRLNREHPNNQYALEADARRALALSQGGNTAEAFELIGAVEKRGIEKLDAQLVGAIRYEKAWLLRERDQPDAAVQAYRALLDTQIDSGLRAHALIELADLEIGNEQYEPAAEYLRQALKHAEREPSVEQSLFAGARYRLALCEHRLGQHRSAVELFDQYLRSDYSDSSLVTAAHLMAGESNYQLGQHRPAAAHFAAVIETANDTDMLSSSLLRLGECEAALQRWPASERAFADYLDRFSDSPLWFQAQFGQGWARENQGRHDDAMQAYRAVVDRHDGETASRAQFQIGECLFAQRKYDLAVAEYLKVDVLYAYPQWSAAALYEAGRCFEAMGQPAPAREQFERIRAEFSDTKWAPMAASRLAATPAATLPAR